MGTRFLPATKTMPKEMLPIIDTPVLQFVIEEAVASGIEDVLIVTGRGKSAIENHFDYNPELEAFLTQNGKADLIPQVRDVAERCRVFYVRQKEQLGLGDAIRIGRRHMGAEPFAVLLGDTIIDPPPGAPPGLRQLIDAYEAKQASVVAVHRVPREWTSRYGIVDGEDDGDHPGLVRLKRLVEKPAPEKAPSDLARARLHEAREALMDLLMHLVLGRVPLERGDEEALAHAVRHFDLLMKLRRAERLVKTMHQHLLSLYPDVSEAVVEEARHVHRTLRAVQEAGSVETDEVPALSDVLEQGLSFAVWVRHETGSSSGG